jgi:hypothetical protein
MRNVVGLTFNHAVELTPGSGKPPLPTSVLASAFCGSTVNQSGKFRIVLGPKLDAPRWKPVASFDCLQPTQDLAGTLTGSASPIDWVAVFDMEVRWVPWKFTSSIIPNSLASSSALGHDLPTAEYFTVGIPQAVSREIATDSVEVGIDAGNRVRVALGATFDADALVLSISPEQSNINVGDLGVENLPALIGGAPDLSNFIGQFPILTINQILAAQPNQGVSIPQGGGKTLDVSKLQLEGSADQLHIRGDYHSAKFDAAIDSIWTGRDLGLSRISVVPMLEKCRAGDFDCIERNASKNVGAGTLANAYTAINKNKKLRPGTQEKHDVQIGSLHLMLTTDILRSTTDGKILNFVGSANLVR